jgi:hypothetical protein
MQSQTRSHAVAVAALALGLSGGVAAGCGGSSGRPADNFIGHWLNEATTTGFTMTCSDPVFAPLFPAGMNDFPIFSTLTFEHGELTDLAETSGSCNLFNYNIKGNTATVANPDPYLNDTPGCLFHFLVADQNGYPLDAFVVLTPDASWMAKLLPDKTEKGADRLQLIGTASADILVDDGSTQGVQTATPCTYGGMDTFFRLTRP